MPLATQASAVIVGNIPGVVGITCHQAVWYWAAEEATAQGLVPARAFVTRMGNLTMIPGGPQVAMLNMPRISALDFNLNPNLPAAGTVLLWLTGPTHSAVVTANGISGYNQSCVFPHVPNTGTYSTGQVAQLGAGKNLCYMIAETDIIRTAGAVFHL